MKQGIIVLSDSEQIPITSKDQIIVNAEDEDDVHYWWHYLIVKGCREIKLVSKDMKLQVILNAFC